MRLSFSRPQRPHTIYVIKSYRDNCGKSTTVRVETLGTEEEIEQKHNCSDGLLWAKAYVAKLNEEERLGKQRVRLEIAPNETLQDGDYPLRNGGDIMLLSLYHKLGLPDICKEIQTESRVKYDLNEVLQYLVMGRILFPGSKISTFKKSKGMIKAPKFDEHDMFRALSLLSGHINEIQAKIYRNSLSVIPRRDKVIFYDCTNFYFEIEDEDEDIIDTDSGEIIEGLRKTGKSKEHRPNPLVQMGMFMDYDGIPLAYISFPGNQSEQTSLQPLEEVLQTQFGMTDFVVSTDAGLGAESNRLYNMEGNREYITVQSLKSMKAGDIKMALDPKGWRISYRENAQERPLPCTYEEGQEIFNLDELRKLDNATQLLRNTTFYKEILVEKELRDNQGRISSRRMERIIVTYNNDYALFQKAKREEHLSRAEKIVKYKSKQSRQSQQDPRRFVEVAHFTADGQKAMSTKMAVKYSKADSEARFDGFYAYGTSLDDDAIDILRIRSFHHEIEHLFRTTKTHLEARPVYVSREDRIHSHFLICFIAMTILKMLQRQLSAPELTIDRLINALRGIQFDYFKGYGYRPLIEDLEVVKLLEELNGIEICKQFIPQASMNKIYRNVKSS